MKFKEMRIHFEFQPRLGVAHVVVVKDGVDQGDIELNTKGIRVNVT